MEQPAGPARFSGPRIARTVIAAVLSGYTVNTLLLVLPSGLDPPRLLAFVGCLAAAFVLQLAHSAAAPLRWRTRTRVATLTTQAAVTFLPFVWVGPQAGALAGFLAGSVLLAIGQRWRWGLYFLIAAGVGVGLWANGLRMTDAGYGIYFTLLTGLMVYGVSSLGSLVAMLYAARGELAQLAVIQERLRVARDLHDLLGFHISAMTLKSELAYRLLPAAADRARWELRDVVAATHRALADIRMIARGEQRMSTMQEVQVARAIFAATEMDLRVDVSLPKLAEEIDTVLAIVAREAATNILRHSKARQCLIEAGIHAGQIQLRVSNDGVEPDPGVPELTGAGLDNLADRVAAVGGRLVATTEDGWFRVTATVPVTPRTVPGVAPGVAAPRPSTHWGANALAAGLARTPARTEPVPDASQPWHRRAARTITLVVLYGYGLLLCVNVLGSHPTVPALLGFAGCVAVLVGIQIVHAFWEPTRWPAWARAGTLGVQAVATVLPLAWLLEPWGSMGGILAGSLLLVLTGPARWVMYGAVGAAVLALALWLGQRPELVGYLTLSTLLTGLVVYAISSLSGMMRRVENARQRQARAAVVRERLRVSRDLQHRLGQHLSEVQARSQRAFRQLPEAPAAARTEVAEMLDVTRRALAEVRVVASGYRHMSLGTEISSAVSTLTAAGVEVDVDAPAALELPQEAGALAALVLREAVTNVIRHSDARTCTIAVDLTAERRIRLLVANNGVPPVPGAPWPPLPAGSGLGDLAERLRAIGGNLTTEAADGVLRLTAELPMEIPTDSPHRSGSTLPGNLPRSEPGSATGATTGAPS